MEPDAHLKSARSSTFRFLFCLGTGMFLFGILFSQTKGPDRTPDLIIFATAAGLLTAALLLGQMPGRMRKAVSRWRSGPLSTLILVIELVLSLSFIKDLVVYGLHRR